MSKMVRKQVFITAEQNKKLKARATATGVAEAELIRAGIELRLEQKLEKPDWRAALDKLSGAWAERDDLEELLAKGRQGWARRRKKLGLAGGK
jgi:Ribbon-helix-helix domain